MDFTGKHVVVTGGTGALGQAVVLRLINAGARCHVPCLEAEVPASCAWHGDERVTTATGIDLSNEDAVRGFYRGLPSRVWASIHIAGGFAMGGIEDTSLADFQKQLSMNLVSCFLCCREAIRAIGEDGRIVNVTARPGLIPEHGAGMTAYATSKAGVAALTRALAAEVAQRRIWINAVAPSIMDTPANREAMPDADHARWPTCEQVGETICFLASESNGVTRGGLVPVYGES